MSEEVKSGGAPESSSERAGVHPERAKRISVSLPAQVHCSPELTIPVRVVNLSVKGFSVVSPVTLTPGLSVELLSRKDADQGIIKWVEGKKAGGEFVGAARLVFE